MYFDHVRCPHCGVAFDPEKIQTQGDSMTCPRCHSQLGLRALFGVSDQFSEEDAPQVTLDDLVPGGPPAGGYSNPEPESSSTPRRGRGSSSNLPARTGSGEASAADVLRNMKKRR